MGDEREMNGRRHRWESSETLCISLQERDHFDTTSTREPWRSYKPNFSAIDTVSCQHHQLDAFAAST